MKKIKFTCSNCQAKLRVPTHLAGVTAPCPKCGAKVTAPADFENFIEEEPRPRAAAKKHIAPAPQKAASPEPATTLVGASAGQQVAELPKPEPVAPAPLVPAEVVTQNPEPAVESNYAKDEIIVESKSRTVPEPKPVLDPKPKVVLPKPMAPPTESVDADMTVPLPLPQPPKPPSYSGGVVAPPVPVLPENLPAAIQHDVISPMPPEPVAEEPPAVAKTQPIKINPRPSSLPPVRESDDSVPGELPRLDTSLAGYSENAAETLTPEQEPEPTKVMLPMPGDSTEQFTPSDFIVPTHTSEEGLAEIAEEVSEIPDLQEFEEPEDALEPIAPIIPVIPDEPIEEEKSPIEDEIGQLPEVLINAPLEAGTEPETLSVAPDVEAVMPPVVTSDEIVQPVEPGPVLPEEIALSIDKLEVSEEEPSISMDELQVTEPLTPIAVPENRSDAIHEQEPLRKVKVDQIENEAQPVESQMPDLTAELGLELASEEPVKEDSVEEDPVAEAEAELEDEFGQFLSGIGSSDDGATDVKAKLDLEEIPLNKPEEKDPILDIFAEPGKEEKPKTSLGEGSFESLLSEQAEPESEELPKPREKILSAKAPKQAAPPEEESKGDEFDEMFGAGSSSKSARSGGGPSRTTVVMLSAIGAVAIISVVVVVLLINASGGIDVATPEPEVEPPPPAIANGPESLASSNPGISPGVDSPGGEAPMSINNPASSEGEIGVPEPPVSADGSSEIIPPASPVDEPPVADSTPSGGDANMIGTDSGPGDGGDPPAMSFDERVLSIVNGDSPSEELGNSGPTSLSSTEMANSAASEFVSAIGENAPGVDPLVSVPNDHMVAPGAGSEVNSSAVGVSNYNPEDSFLAPTSPDDLLGQTHDLLDAYLRAPDWESRMKYVYQGDSLRPSIEQYYQKWAFKRFGTFSKDLFQMEPDKTMGGPYWIYMISTNDNDSGFPIIIREEDGLLKVDWEVYAEFKDEHFVKFLEGDISSPHTLRVVMNRVSDYYGPDREGFTDLDDYFVYQVNPPYGGLNEFSTYAFVKKDSEIANQFEEVITLNQEALAVIVTIEEKPFPHGINHYIISDYVTEGWFR